MNTTVQTVDEGLRQYLVSVYNKMTAALVVSATTAWIAQPFVASLGSWAIVLAFLPLPFVIVLQFMDKMSEAVAHLVFYTYAAATGQDHNARQVRSCLHAKRSSDPCVSSSDPVTSKSGDGRTIANRRADLHRSCF